MILTAVKLNLLAFFFSWAGVNENNNSSRLEKAYLDGMDLHSLDVNTQTVYIMATF